MKSAVDARPPKRARTNSGSPVKHEHRSLSPLNIERRLVTAGTKRYAPIPDNCLTSCPEYRQNRSLWIARCAGELQELSLVPGRKLIRDDGLIIDWKSQAPVWSDTLKPDTLDLAATIVHAHRSNAQWRRPPIHTGTETPPEPVFTLEPPTSSSPHPPSKKKVPVPPRPSLIHRRNNASHPTSTNSSESSPSRPASGSSFRFSERPRSPNGSERKIASSAQPLPCSSSAGPMPSVQHSRSVLPDSSAEEEMSQLTLDYLRRYVQTYEADRAGLASAYARNASFAYRVHRVERNTCIASPQCFSSDTKWSRLDIVTTLLTLPCLHSNAQSPGAAQVQYDMFYLGAGLGMFVGKEVDVEDAVIEGVWPLTATAHQILVFET